MSPRLAFALEAAVTAGRSTLAHFQNGVATEYKADSSPVTVADREAESLIRRLITGQFPGEAILGEEEGETGTGDQRWVVDPIDGTKSFICGVPLYATLLAYEVNGRPELGVAYYPVLGDLVYAERGGGAFWNGRPCRVSDQSSLERAAIVSGSLGSMISHGRDEGYRRIAEQAAITRTWGDAYGHVLVATGRAEVMIDPIVSHWDIAALQVIVEEAAGRFTDFSGRHGVYGEAISSNGRLHDVILEHFET
jgi:histidinol phosphatase-like enzyme (inositol monophosphatase family)